ncbi:rod shape-determining protein RodA [candidate division WOR-1 bacterium RIFOXYB2_FULL_42_35]|uniref:Peptidoglycan glycosyltransferase RodA n=1 Tax=candidate division WOR-1 bacterium RIFOXYC2_FULL_41_25 TaxID=1802586 RepID=A0A1F4TMY2_UNCSA|nr:MAG: rod shape-determining protein RodA [candidate division WOR-1 bacterium RIFOXYA2_FULL_41_14]OGC23152.1 MAG: rod shape-determining protein RodA [candidate division WOR-1 bacterium RIFOXYB2_FULL_42_35]OGC34068.1 MAG: rod shape-determining protein RodA [candidate division WOR-1 bacterium RIFOXYC2_FULL_41_25]
MFNLRMLKLSDLLLWIASGALIVISLFAIFSSSYSLLVKVHLDPFLYVKRQLISFLIGSVGLAIFAYLDYKRLKRLSIFFYLGMLTLLALITFGGGRGASAQRWLAVGGFSFQPSELAKIVIVICLAAFFSAKNKVETLTDAVALLALVGIPFLLIFKQPDLGTALVFIFILIGMLTISGSSSRLLILLTTPMISVMLRPFLFMWFFYLLLIVLALFLSRSSLWDWFLILGLNIGVGIAMPYIWDMLKTYQQQRILTFLNPGADPYGAGYHSLQSQIAIGSGGVFGKGFLHGSQTQLNFIPEQHSDFIFSAIGEEFGFIGTSLVLGLFALFIWRAMEIAKGASDYFGSLLAYGIAVMTAFHVFANVGMTLGLLPVVGMPLPFVSYGGSSLIMNMISIGILQSISMRRQKLIF